MSRTAPACDIFCTVVDNFGDAGVCWRLARQLAEEHGWRVRLWIDDPAPLGRLAPDRNGVEVEVLPWTTPWPDVRPAEVVIEAFACHLPEAYVEAMARRGPPPVWINLEYLSAEPWIAGCHGLPSPHPRLPLVKHFFFPGFDAATGGLIRESSYAIRRMAFDESAFRREFGIPERSDGSLTISLFSYPQAPIARLLDSLAASDHPVTVLRPAEAAGPKRGALLEIALPFLPQSRFDELLWACDLNFVRGEDSFVRAQWAAKPFVWNIYPQTEDGHLRKLDAFLDRYPGGERIRRFWHAWNGQGGLDWPGFESALGQIRLAATTWADTLSSRPDLAKNLVEFCLARLK